MIHYRIHWFMVLVTPALLCHKDKAQGTESPLLGAFLTLLVSLRDKGGFRALKGSILGAALSNIMIEPMIDSFCADGSVSITLL